MVQAGSDQLDMGGTATFLQEVLHTPTARPDDSGAHWFELVGQGQSWILGTSQGLFPGRGSRPLIQSLG
jgi:hypothetical protein